MLYFTPIRTLTESKYDSQSTYQQLACTLNKSITIDEQL